MSEKLRSRNLYNKFVNEENGLFDDHDNLNEYLNSYFEDMTKEDILKLDKYMRKYTGDIYFDGIYYLENNDLLIDKDVLDVLLELGESILDTNTDETTFTQNHISQVVFDKLISYY